MGRAEESEVAKAAGVLVCTGAAMRWHTRTTALSNSMKLSHARGATQDGQVRAEMLGT